MLSNSTKDAAANILMACAGGAIVKSQDGLSWAFIAFLFILIGLFVRPSRRDDD